MSASKFLVLVGGIVGLIAFFMPMAAVTRQGVTAKVSAFQVVKGLDSMEATVESNGEKSHVTLSAEQVNETKDGIEKVKGVILAFFAPAFLFVLFGIAGIARKRFGRVIGTFSLLFGLVSLGVAALLNSAFTQTGNADSKGIAVTLLFVSSIAAVIGGLMALIKPERLAVA
ncbi:MAG TPA: hypothetical protein VGM88_14075 [Kofleriaceae bacterium]|jgi:hypothetical protein